MDQETYVRIIETAHKAYPDRCITEALALRIVQLERFAAERNEVLSLNAKQAQRIAKLESDQ